MPTLRVHGAQVVTPPTLRVHTAYLTGSVPASVRLRVHGAQMAGAPAFGPKLRVHNAQMGGTAGVFPKLRVHRAFFSGTVSVVLQSIETREVEPRSTVVTVAASAPGVPAAEGYSWRQISGPTVALVPSGDTLTIVAPSVMPPTAKLYFGVKGQVGGNYGPETVFEIDVFPQTRWTWNGTEWVGAGTLVLP